MYVVCSLDAELYEDCECLQMYFTLTWGPLIWGCFYSFLYFYFCSLRW